MSKTEAVVVKVAQEVVAVELKNIQLHPDNGRDKKNLDLDTLKSSIQATGQLVPGLARKLPDGTIQLVCGSRRYKALTELKAPTMNLIIGDLTDFEAIEAMVTENLQRKDMSLFEELKEIKKLVSAGEASQLTSEAISQRLGRPLVWARRVMALTKLTKADLKIIEETFDFTPELDVLARLAALDSEARAAAIDSCQYDHTNKDAIQTLDAWKTSLKDAQFDTAACNGCTNNSATQPGLWDDGKSKDGTCLNQECFHKKHRDAAIAMAIDHANKKPEEPFYVAVSRGDNGADKMPKNVVIVDDYAYGDEKKWIRAFSLAKAKFVQVDGPKNDDAKPKAKTGAVSKEAPIEKQIEAKQDTLQGLRLKIISEKMKNMMYEINSAPTTFAGFTSEEKLRLVLAFGCQVNEDSERVEKELNAVYIEARYQHKLWEGMKNRIIWYINCDTGITAMFKSDRIKHVCKILGFDFDALMAEAKLEKPDPKSLTTLLAGKELNDKSAAKKKAKK
jgi:ParB/RepB/Spo0J family partition protein